MSYIITARILVDDSKQLRDFIERLIRQGCHIVERDRYLGTARSIRSISGLVKHDEDDLENGQRFRYECSYETTVAQKANDLWSQITEEPLVTTRCYTYTSDLIPNP